MMTFLGARLDRSALVLINCRLDGYPAFFHVEPEAIGRFLTVDLQNDSHAALLVEEQWTRFAPIFEKLINKHGNDFVATAAMLGL
ncbi:hypothetical protein QU487_21095 [Crenobacter sp. SG2305]|uniref:hypothetical protein n=1 Tax=Crenobacter oryzisoli TaxID=3056844 RepID=UPI0025AB22D4|nr:hypothetical protein [Crenobacter sp. SG2305]MDN0085208.1 hypothetical protein [Crenobacter sp. SG2305]